MNTTSSYTLARSSSLSTVESRSQFSKTATTVLAIGASVGLGIGLGALIARVGNIGTSSSCSLASLCDQARVICDQARVNCGISNLTLCEPSIEQLQRERDCRIANITVPEPSAPLPTNYLNVSDIPDGLLEKSISQLTSPIANISIPRDCSRIEIMMDGEAWYIKSKDYSIDRVLGRGYSGLKPLETSTKITLAKKILQGGFEVKLVIKSNNEVKKKVLPGQVIDSLKIKEKNFDFTTKDLINKEGLRDSIENKLNACETKMSALASQENTDEYKEQLNTWCNLFKYKHK